MGIDKLKSHPTNYHVAQKRIHILTLKRALTPTPLRTSTLAVFQVQSEGIGIGWDHLEDVCRTEQGQRSSFLG